MSSRSRRSRMLHCTATRGRKVNARRRSYIHGLVRSELQNRLRLCATPSSDRRISSKLRHLLWIEGSIKLSHLFWNGVGIFNAPSAVLAAAAASRQELTNELMVH